MKRSLIVILLTLLLLAPAVSALAQPLPVTDARALGMGGAFVAAGSGITAVQYNPALLGEGKLVELSVPEVMVQIEDQGGLIDAVDALAPAGSISQVAALSGKLVQLEGNAAAGVGLQAFGIGLGVTYSRLVSGEVMPVVDTIIPTNTYLYFAGLETTQLIFTGAKELGPVTLGVNLRQISGTSYATTINAYNNPDIDLDTVTSGGETDVSGTSFDVGAVLPLVPTLDVGLVIRDANEPDLDGVKLERSIRAGAALNLPFILVSADYDISVPEDAQGNENKSWAVGAELDLPILELRGGLSDNGLDGAPTVTHLGVGLGGELFKLDIGAAYADGGDYYAAGVNLAMKF